MFDTVPILTVEEGFGLASAIAGDGGITVSAIRGDGTSSVSMVVGGGNPPVPPPTGKLQANIWVSILIMTRTKYLDFMNCSISFLQACGIARL